MNHVFPKRNSLYLVYIHHFSHQHIYLSLILYIHSVVCKSQCTICWRFSVVPILRNIALVATKRCVCDRQCTCCQIARKWFVLCWRELKEVKYMVLTYNNSPEWKLHQRSNVMMISYWQCMLNSLLEKNCWLVHLKIFWSILTHIYIIFCGRKFLT